MRRADYFFTQSVQENGTVVHTYKTNGEALPPKKRSFNMALSRKFLTALGIEDDKIDEIITAHTDTVNALKEQRDNYKEDAEKLAEVTKERDELKKQIDTDGENSFEKKYNELKATFDEYKGKVEADNTKRAKSKAYKALLKEAGIGDKYIDSVLKVADFDKIELDGDKIKNADKLTESVKNEFSAFVVENSQKGADTANPPANVGARKTKEEIAAIKDTAERQQAMLENADLYGI